MTVIGVVRKYSRYGEIQYRHVVYETKTAPDSDTTINATSTGTVTVSIAQEVPRDILYAGLESITGLPGGVYVQSISVDKTNKTLSTILYNTNTVTVTLNAGTLTLNIVSIA